MTPFNYRGFRVTITGSHGAYGYIADNGKHYVADPNPGFTNTKFASIQEAVEAAKDSIIRYEIMALIATLSWEEKAFVRYVTKQLYDKKWIVDSRSALIQQVLEAGQIHQSS